MSSSTPRKGASRLQDVSAELKDALSRGVEESATLTEGLAVDQALLLRSVFSGLHPASYQAAEEACALGIVKRMAALAEIILAAQGPQAVELCQAHPSDTVRGWACFMIAAQPAVSLSERLAQLRPLADDPHFGVREWAWLAVRPHLLAELPLSFSLLIPWTAAPSERLRRFACESLRPRGVWCSHSAALKKDPALGLPLLEPLRADPAVYVQDSVANWLNDAAKDHPAWVQDLCARWADQSPTPATSRICTRALRSLR